MELSMVALKVQSLDGIVTAYLQSLGYQGENLQTTLDFLMKNYADKLNQEDVIASMDEILYAAVKKYLPSQRGDKTQALAMFKTLFLLEKGAENCGSALFENGFVTDELQQKLKANPLQAAPQVKMTTMEAQKIETLPFFAFLGKIFHLFRKG